MRVTLNTGNLVTPAGRAFALTLFLSIAAPAGTWLYSSRDARESQREALRVFDQQQAAKGRCVQANIGRMLKEPSFDVDTVCRGSQFDRDFLAQLLVARDRASGIAQRAILALEVGPASLILLF